MIKLTQNELNSICLELTEYGKELGNDWHNERHEDMARVASRIYGYLKSLHTLGTLNFEESQYYWKYFSYTYPLDVKEALEDGYDI